MLNIYFIILLLESFSHQLTLMVFHWSLIDNKSSLVSRTHLSILAVLHNVVVWIVSTRSLISMFSSFFNNPLVTVSKSPITSSIIVTFTFHCFFNAKGVAPSPTPLCSSYWKGSLRVALDYDRQLYSFMIDTLSLIRIFIAFDNRKKKYRNEMQGRIKLL